MHRQSNSPQVHVYLTIRDKYLDRWSLDDDDEVADDGVLLLGSKAEGVLDDDAEGVKPRLGSFFSCRSNVWSCSMKWKLGEMSGLRARTNVKASLSPKPLAHIRYARVIVTDCKEVKQVSLTCRWRFEKLSTYSWDASQTVHQTRHILRSGFFDETYRFGKVSAQVLWVVVNYWDFKIHELIRVFEDIRQLRHVQDVANVVFLNFRDVHAVRFIAQEQSRNNLDRLAAIRLKRIVGATLPIRRFSWAAARWVRKRCWNAKRPVNMRIKIH